MSAIDWCDEPFLTVDPAHVEAELRKATLPTEARRWLCEQGVPAKAIEDVTEAVSGFVFGVNQTFHVDPPEEALAVERCFHLPVTRDGALIDVIRFTRKHAKTHRFEWGSRVCRRSTWLGDAEAVGTGKWPKPTRVWRSALGWLRAGRQGLVYLRNSTPTHRFAPLRALAAIQGEDTRHSLLLDECTWQDNPKGKPQHWARIADPVELAIYAAGQAARGVHA